MPRRRTSFRFAADQGRSRRRFIAGATLAATGGLAAARADPALAKGEGLHVRQGGKLEAPEPTRLWSFQPRDRSKGPFQTVFAGVDFNGQFDTVMYGPGYNQGFNGARHLKGEPSFGICLEQHYLADSGSRFLEWYLEAGHSSFDGLGPPDGPTRRPMMLQLDRTSGALAQFELRADNFTFSSWETGIPYATLDTNGFAFGSPVGRSVTLELAPPLGHGSAFHMKHDGASALHVSTNSPSNVAASVGGKGTLWLFDGRAAIGLEDASAALTAQESNGASVFVARAGRPGQTGQFFAARSADGETTHWRVGPRGHMFVARTDAPPDEEIRPGECALWFDPTDGATKLMLKGKQANGTVRTGEVALT